MSFVCSIMISIALVSIVICGVFALLYDKLSEKWILLMSDAFFVLFLFSVVGVVLAFVWHW